MIHQRITPAAVIIISIGAVIAGMPSAAEADTASSSIATGAAAIVGALLDDSGNRPCYVPDMHRCYVRSSEAHE